MMPPTSSSTESSKREAANQAWAEPLRISTVAEGETGRQASIGLSDPQFVRRLERSSAAAANDGGTIAASQRIGDFLACTGGNKVAPGQAQAAGLGHEEGKCSISFRCTLVTFVVEALLVLKPEPDTKRYTKENNLPDKSPTPDEKLQQEFNRWAEAGEGEKMENHHLDITEKTMRLMDLRPGERVLDLGLRLGLGHAAAVAPGGRWARGLRPGRWSRRFRRDDSAGARGFERLRKYFVRLGIGAADSVGRKFLRQGACRSNRSTTMPIRIGRCPNCFASWRRTGACSS